MQRIYKFISSYILILICLTVIAGDIKANHVQGVPQLHVECLGNDQYEVTLDILSFCQGLTPPQSEFITVESLCGTNSITVNQVNSQDLTPVCESQCTTCESGCTAFHGYVQVTYQGVVDLSGISCCAVEFFYSHGTRSANNQSPSYQSVFSKASVDICQAGCISTPKFVEPPLNVVCKDQQLQINQAAVAGENDSLVYELSAPFVDTDNRINYEQGYNKNAPLDYLGKGMAGITPSSPFPFGFHLDRNTGDLAFTPVTSMIGVMAIKVSQFRDGNLLSETYRDMRVIVENCDNAPPVLLEPLELPYTICQGETMNLDLTIADPDSTHMVYFNWGEEIDGAAYTNDSGLVYATGNFEWTPDTGDVSDIPHNLTYYSWNNKCPFIGKRSQTLKIKVNPDPIENIGHAQTGCGEFTFTGELLNIDGGTFEWNIENEVDTIKDVFSYVFTEPGVYPYQVTVSDVGCERTFYDTVYVASTLTLQAGNDTTICGEAVINVSPEVQNNQGAVTFELNGVSFSESINATVTGDTLLIVTAQDSLGCMISDTIHVTVPDIPEPNVGDQAFCAGEQPVVSTAQHAGINITWMFANGLVISGSDEITIPQPGNYVLEYASSTLAGCALTDTFNVQLATTPSRKLSDTTICDVEEVFEVNAPLNTHWYEWRHLTSGAVIGNNRLLEYTSPESGYIMLETGEMIGNRSCSYRDTFNLSVEEVSDTSGFLPPQALCLNDPPHQLSESIWGETNWSGPGVDNENIWHPRDAGVGGHELVYEYTDNQTGCVVTRTYHSEILPLPELSFTVDPVSGEAPLQVQLEANAVDPVKDFSWTIMSDTGFYKSVYNNVMEVQHTFNAGGTHTISFSATDTTTGCRDTIRQESVVNVFLPPTSINLPDGEDSEHLHVYPNPAGDVLNIRSAKVLQSATLTNVAGQTVGSYIIEDTEFRIERGVLPAGTYILQAIKDDGSKDQVRVVFE